MKLSHYLFAHKEKCMLKLGKCNAVKKVFYQNENLIVNKLQKCVKLPTLARG